jgi:hypothetical protein
MASDRVSTAVKSVIPIVKKVMVVIHFTNTRGFSLFLSLDVCITSLPYYNIILEKKKKISII